MTKTVDQLACSLIIEAQDNPDVDHIAGRIENYIKQQKERTYQPRRRGKNGDDVAFALITFTGFMVVSLVVIQAFLVG